MSIYIIVFPILPFERCCVPLPPFGWCCSLFLFHVRVVVLSLLSPFGRCCFRLSLCLGGGFLLWLAFSLFWWSCFSHVRVWVVLLLRPPQGGRGKHNPSVPNQTHTTQTTTPHHPPPLLPSSSFKHHHQPTHPPTNTPHHTTRHTKDTPHTRHTPHTELHGRESRIREHGRRMCVPVSPPPVLQFRLYIRWGWMRDLLATLRAWLLKKPKLRRMCFPLLRATRARRLMGARWSRKDHVVSEIHCFLWLQPVLM